MTVIKFEQTFATLCPIISRFHPRVAVNKFKYSKKKKKRFSFIFIVNETIIVIRVKRENINVVIKCSIKNEKLFLIK